MLQVATSGAAQAYTFNVTVESPDTGCDQYANWWEVVSPDEELIYRRILNHSHVSEQPFTRSGGPVPVDADQTVVVRAYMHPTGYGGAALSGSVASGFAPIVLPTGFGADLDMVPPLPTGCDY